MQRRSIQELLKIANEHHRSGRLDQATNLYGKILAQDPGNSNALHLMGLIAHQRGDHQGAARLISRAIAISPREPSFHFNLGVVQTAAGLLDSARDSYRKALLNRPDYPEAHNNLGLVLERLGLHRDARDSCERALKLRPDFADALLNLGNIHKNQGELDQAAAAYERVLALNPNCAGVHNNLGNLMLRRGRLEDAVECYRRSHALNPKDVDPANNLGGTLMRLGRHEEALRYFNIALGIAPNHPGTHFNKSWLLLLNGEFESGWKEYEWRLKMEEQTRAVYRRLTAQRRPVWEGGPLEGKSILVHSEQGLGDTIQFIRYLPWLKNRGAKVLLCCQKELISLLSSAPGIDVLLEEPADGEINEAFDYHIPLLSLPGLLHSHFPEISAGIPYLHVERNSIEEWKPRLKGDRLKVGIVWAGRPTNAEDWRRSCKLDDFAPLGDVPGAVFFSLQKGPAGREALHPPQNMRVMDLGNDLKDFKDTAAAIMNFDLVIAVDTAVAHLAGALARPVWTLLPLFPDWRWRLKREDSDWYPTMRLFRQPRNGDWGSVFGKVAEELRLLRAGR